MLSTDNPWLEPLPSEGPYVLDMDRKAIDRYNDSVRDPEAKIMLGSIPEPFIGNPGSARVVLLNLNPGHSEKDEKDHRGAELQKAMFQNLRHESQEYPFYPLNPAFKETGAGRWWRKRTRQLREESGLDDRTFAKRLMVIEWFPYHSRKFAPLKHACKSQEYSFQLARKMLDRKLLVIRMRARKQWMEVDQQFAEVRSLENPQCGYIRGNTGR
jgi:hypothetical protein